MAVNSAISVTEVNRGVGETQPQFFDDSIATPSQGAGLTAAAMLTLPFSVFQGT